MYVAPCGECLGVRFLVVSSKLAWVQQQQQIYILYHAYIYIYVHSINNKTIYSNHGDEKPP